MPKIKVHEKALAHLSRGLYRSPASALRELVSNAWDADATTVTINTNYPNFYQLSIEDDGTGFSKSDFEQLMQGGIGNSQKRPELKLINDRPVIGRFGIGMLGIAQICGAFVVTSKPKDGSEGFRARAVVRPAEGEARCRRSRRGGLAQGGSPTVPRGDICRHL
jgi:HSP90 family molecular chaperone